MLHPATQLVHVGADIGLGVVATAEIPMGTIVWARDRFDVALDPASVEALDPAHRALVDRYGHVESGGDTVLCWDLAKFVNHHCTPTVRGIGDRVQIAVRDIAVGDPITCDYAECNLGIALACRCGAAGCRGQVDGRDLLEFARGWDLEVRAAVRRAGRVDQPLAPFVLDPEGVAAMLAGERETPSLASVFCRTHPQPGPSTPPGTH